MRTVIAVTESGSWTKKKALSTVTLSFEDRFRRRIRMTDDNGDPFMLNLPDATQLNDGDGLMLKGGGIIAVKAAPEKVCDAFAHSPLDTARIAWHIGNRHIPVQVLPNGGLRIQDDHVIAHMLTHLGAKVIHHIAPFSPESGAYGDHGSGHAHVKTESINASAHSNN